LWDAWVKAEPTAQMTRGFGLRHAVALNVANMVGVGPFITIPLLLASMGGPQALLGWVVGALIVICDGQVWSELGAALPGSGGSYQFLKETYGRESWGRMMAFLFIWQFVLSGPLEIASGMIGFANYAGFIWPGMTPIVQRVLAASVGVAAVLFLSRRITSLGKLTVTLTAGTFLTMAVILLTGILHFDARRAFDFPPHAFGFNGGFFLGLGGASLISIYDYLGYYDICYLGDEVRDPGRVIPRAIIYSIAFCVVAYMGTYLVVIGVVPWKAAIESHFVVSELIERIHGRTASVVVTVMVLWTAFGSVFALMLGYSRVPYAAARDGYFFKPFARLHETKGFPYVSLYVLGGISVAASFFNLDQVVSALITTRILVQFIGQILALPLLRKRLAAKERPYKMPLYPIPAVVAFFGWMYIFLTSGWGYVIVGVATLIVGIGAFLAWSKVTRGWPFAVALGGDRVALEGKRP
jgi:APA family basic amino acid/polyamine antiporter